MNNIKTYRNYSTTILLNPSYSIGFCAFIFIIIQIISGYTLSNNYIPSKLESFNIIHNIIMRELDTSFLIRFNHINGCAFLFIILYIHIYRSIYYNSISKTSIWIIGIIMYILLCIISFTGYSIVYGQMSLWAIVVICSLVTAIPIIGNKLLLLIWGGNRISNVTLQRIFCIHYLFPLLLLLLIIIHLYNLHNINSTGDIYYIYSINNRYDRINLYPLLLIRDIFIGSNILIIYNIFVYYNSDFFGHSDNYIPANALVTPLEIMPEFYLLPFYGLIRSIPHKILGIFLILILLICITNIYPIFRIIYYNNISLYSRILLIIIILEIFIGSLFCILINHLESLTILLLICINNVISHNIINTNYFHSNN